MTHQSDLSRTKGQMYNIPIGEEARLIGFHHEEPSMCNIEITSEAKLIKLIADEDNGSIMNMDQKTNDLNAEYCQNSTNETDPYEETFTADEGIM